MYIHVYKSRQSNESISINHMYMFVLLICALGDVHVTLVSHQYLLHFITEPLYLKSLNEDHILQQENVEMVKQSNGLTYMHNLICTSFIIELHTLYQSSPSCMHTRPCSHTFWYFPSQNLTLGHGTMQT